MKYKVVFFFIIIIIIAITYGYFIQLRENAKNVKTDFERYENVVLIVIDTLRHDKLGCYGNPKPVTPYIDFLSRRGTQFSQCFAHSPWTLPSIASLFSSMLPSDHKAGGSLGAFSKLDEKVETLAECFQKAKYETACIVNVDFLTSIFGMTRGFQFVDERIFPNNEQLRNAKETTRSAINWLKRSRSKPFFLFIHYFDPHLVYDPPMIFRKMYAEPRDAISHQWEFGTRSQIVDIRRGVITLNNSNIVARAEKLYDGEVAYTDHEIGVLLHYLSDTRLTQNTLIVLTSDHGEEFFDHNSIDHGHTLYDELVRVPLVMSFQRGVSDYRNIISQTVRHIDVGPTILEIVGLSKKTTFQGTSLIPLIDDNEQLMRPVVFYGNFWGPPLTGCYSGNIKLIKSPIVPDKCYDLLQDASESNNIAALDYPGRAECHVVLSKILSRKPRGWSIDQTPIPVTLDDQTRRRLHLLGYLE